ncbi:S1 family peptidase [Paractinoplanes deccanensis]|uniref:S1 family peptidase n=1 Tax=Paractinoplanes deccanensis TaxID=113561 RepID=UPI0019441501|nr:trypsin-like serine protease [Actinoplanes deccanensis]
MRRRYRLWGSGLLVAGLSAAFLGGGSASAVAGAQEVPDGGLPFVAKLTIGDTFRSCTGALVDARWIVTAKSCFADTAGAVVAGAPAWPASVVLGRADLTKVTGQRLSVVSLVPHPDRGIVLAELSAAVKNITPVSLSGDAAQAGETVSIAGYGRTSTEWVPNRMHSGDFTVGSVSAGRFAITAASAGATLCKGDAGAPAFRDTASGPQLVGVSVDSGQKGCLGEPGTRTDEASGARTDDLGDWVRTSTATVPSGISEPVTGEFTRDGRQDLAGVDASGVLWLYPGTATPGVWGHRVRIGSGFTGFRELEVGRINRDGYDDLLAIEGSTNAQVYYPGTAAGGAFGARTVIGSGWTTDLRDVAVGKVDRDAYDDLLVVKASTQQLFLYRGNATGGSFSAGVVYGSGWGCCKELQVGKFNADDYDDLLTVESATGKMRIYPGTEAGTQFGPGADTGSGAGWNTASFLAKAKLDGTGIDGLLEVDTAGKAWLHQRTAEAGWPARVAAPGKVSGPQPGELSNIVTGKFNRDAFTDLLGVDSAGVAWMHPGTAANTFGPRVQLATGWGGLRELAVGRINRDGYDDLLAIDGSTNAQVYYPGTAAGGAFGSRVTIGSGWTTDLRDVAVGKVDRDAYDDLLVVKTSTQQLFLYKGTAAGGSFAAGVVYGSGWGCCKELQVAKFSGDDYDDLQTVQSATGKLVVYGGKADGSQFEPGVDTGSGTGWNARSNLVPVTFGSDTSAGLLAKDNAGNLLVHPQRPVLGVDLIDPITFGPRD